MKHFSIGELVSKGWEAMKSRFGFFVGLLITALVITGLPSILAQFLEEKHPLLSSLVGILHFVLGTLISMGLIYVGIRVARGESASITDLFTKSSLFFNYLGAEILYILMVFVGLLFFIVPGIYLAVRYGLFGYLIVDKNMGAIESLKESSRITEGARWDLFGLWFVLWIINLLGLLALGVGLFVAYPVSLVAGALAYLKLSDPANAEKRDIV